MGFGIELAKGAAADAAGGILDLAFGGIKNRRQLKQQAALNEQQKGMMDYQQQKQMEMWEKTGYSAQVKQMKAAGINPGLLYGMSGGGGQTTGNTSSASPQAMDLGIGRGGAIQQMAMNAAETKLMESQAKLNNVQADKLQGIDTKEGEQRIAESTVRIKEIAASTANKEQQTVLLKIAEEMSNLKLKFDKETYNENVDLLVSAAQNAKELVHQMEVDTFVKRATRNTVVDTMRAELIGIGIKNDLMKAQIKLTDAEVWEIAETISQGWEKLSIEDQKNVISREINKVNQQNADTNKQNADVNKERLTMDEINAASERIRGWVETITGILPWKKGTGR